MNRLQKRRIVWSALAVCWMVIIFCFSHQKAEDSGAISEMLSYHLVEGVNGICNLNLDQDTVEFYAVKLEHPVRKAAHMTEYAVLAGLLLGNFVQYPGFYKKRYLWSLSGAVVYAATDEFHQLFIEGRSGEIKDVCIDATGAIIGLALICLFGCLRRVCKK